MTSQPELEYWTARDVGALLRCSDKSVYRIARADATFPVVRIGGMVRFPRERVLRWFRDREQGTRRLHVVPADRERGERPA